MTPERRKYLEHISKREKALRNAIAIYNSYIQHLKVFIKAQEGTPKERAFEDLKYTKFILCALKRELERIQTTDVEFINCTDGVIDYEGGVVDYKCCNCHKEFIVYLGDDMPSHCPYCHRKIERGKGLLKEYNYDTERTL